MKFSTDFPTTHELTNTSAAFTAPGKRAHRFLFNSIALAAPSGLELDDGDRPQPPPQQQDAPEVHTPVTAED